MDEPTEDPDHVWPGADSASRAEVAQDPLGVVALPGLAGLPGGVFLVEADQHVGQLAADRLGLQQCREYGQVDQPVGIPAGPVVIGAIYDPEDAMVGFGC